MIGTCIDQSNAILAKQYGRRWRDSVLFMGSWVVVQCTPFSPSSQSYLVPGIWYTAYDYLLHVWILLQMSKNELDDHSMSPNNWSKQLAIHAACWYWAQTLKCRCHCSCSSSCCLHAMQTMNSNTYMMAINKPPKKMEAKDKVMAWYMELCMV